MYRIPAGAQDRAAVKIYLISSLNRVIFTFVNTLEQIERHRDFVSLYYKHFINFGCVLQNALIFCPFLKSLTKE